MEHCILPPLLCSPLLVLPYLPYLTLPTSPLLLTRRGAVYCVRSVLTVIAGSHSRSRSCLFLFLAADTVLYYMHRLDRTYLTRRLRGRGRRVNEMRVIPCDSSQRWAVTSKMDSMETSRVCMQPHLRASSSQAQPDLLRATR